MTQEFEEREFDQDETKSDTEHAEEPLHDEGGEPQGRGGRGDRGDRGGDRMRRERIGSFEQMKVWQEAHALTIKVFNLTPNLPGEQQAGVAQQMEEAAVSVPRNIAEGFKRRGPRNKAHFYNLAQSSLEALRYYFILCRDLKYEIPYEDVAMHTEQVSRMLDGLIRSMMRS